MSSFLAGCAIVSTEPQGAPSVHRVGFLHSGSPQPYYEEFVLGLREAGYGENLLIEYRYAEGRRDRLPALAQELLELSVGVILAVDTPAIQAARDATSTVPIVMGVSGDPVGAGFVASLARPGGNITGLSILAPETPLGGAPL